MSLIIATVTFVVLSIMIPIVQNKRKTTAYTRMEEAKKRNDTATATLVSKRLVYGRNKRTTNINEYHCRYVYKVNNKEYTFEYCTVNAPQTMQIYYDRNNGYKRIDLSEESNKEKFLRYAPIVISIVLFFVLNSIL